MADKIGPSFASELAAAGVTCLAQWQSDGVLVFVDGASDADKAKAQALLKAHDPTKPAPASVPSVITNYQARAALVAAGKFDATDKAVRASGDALIIQAWDYANAFYRNSPFIASMAAALKMSASDIDALFVAAGAVQ